MRKVKLWGLAAAMLALASSVGGLGHAQDQDQGGGGHGGHGAVRAACQADIAKLCPGVEPGRGAMQCLRQHQDDASDGCKSAMAAARADHHGHSDGSPEGASSETPPPN